MGAARLIRNHSIGGRHDHYQIEIDDAELDKVLAKVEKFVDNLFPAPVGMNRFASVFHKRCLAVPLETRQLLLIAEKH